MAGTDGTDLMQAYVDAVFDGWLEQARANKQSLDSCARHQFFSRPPPMGNPFGKAFVCLHCGVAMNIMTIANYIRGYKAAGGDPNDIWPGWE